MSQGTAHTDVDAVVVGAGFGGLYMLYKLREMGLSTQVFEAADGVGGTWYWNRYPGARCDVESLAYSYSFDPELEQEWEWSERYPAQPEIEKYLNHVADRYGLRRDIALETKVTAATFDDDTATWTIETDTGRSVTCRWFITAVGCLSKPKQIDIEGKESFSGPTYHTALWPDEDVDFAGKRVAVIGTGSTGIQVIPEIAKEAGHLTVFQRTPNFSLPAQNRDLTSAEVAEFKADYRRYREEQRASGYGVPAPPPEPSALDVSADERTREYQKGWDEGGFIGLVGKYADVLTDRDANETVAQFVRDKIAAIVEDPEIAAKLSPTDYPFATKRPCLDTRYYETYNRDNVTLVDLRETPIERITESGVLCSDRLHEVDAIVFATGFDAMVGALNAIDIRGRNGSLLRDDWREGPRTYLGVSVAGYPNMFTITGPQSPSVFSNMIVSIEQHVEWIADCVSYVEKAGAAGIEATSAAQDGWVSHVSELADGTLFPETDSWYVGANVPGKPRVFMPYVGGVGFYRETCDEIARKDYEGFELVASRGDGAAVRT